MDPRFGLQEDDVREAVERAAALWEEALGRPLFSERAGDGFPIRVVFDERQEFADELRRHDEALGEAARRLDGRAENLADRQENLARELEEHRARQERFREELSTHNERVRRWNEERGERSMEEELQRAEARLEERRSRLNVQADELERRQERLREEVDRFNRDARSFNRNVQALVEGTGELEIQSGVYRRQVRERGGQVVSVEREIEIYHFADPTHLVLVLAHELGHALSLPHAQAPEAVMSARSAERPPDQELSLHPEDVELLRRACDGS